MLTGIVSAAIGLGLMVLVHEWGHFIVARLFGVRVEVFSIGFGPRLWGVRAGHRLPRQRAAPGRLRADGGRQSRRKNAPALPDEFLSKPRWQRVLIALAGPTTNLPAGHVLMAGLFMHGSEQPIYADKPVVIAGVMKDSPAQKAGIQAGDRIVSLAGTRIRPGIAWHWNWLFPLPGHMRTVVIERGGQLIAVTRGRAAAAIRSHGISRRADARRFGELRAAAEARWFNGGRHDHRSQWPAHQQPVRSFGGHSAEQGKLLRLDIVAQR